MEQTNKLFFLGLLTVIVFGTYIRLIPVLDVGTEWLADLDPYRNLRAVNEIVSSGRMPVFDSLSAAPNGTYATYMTSQGYYMLNAAVTLVSGLNTIELMSLLPVVCEIALLLAVYVFGNVLTGSRWVGLTAAFFAAIPQEWALDAVIGTLPLAGNFGGVIFPIVLILFWRYVANKRTVFLACSGLLFGVSFLIHPLTYIYLGFTVFLYSVLMYLFERKFAMFVAFVKLFLISLLVVWIEVQALIDFPTYSNFSRGALWLVSLQPVHHVVGLLAVITEVGLPIIFLGLVAVTLLLYERKARYLILISWCAGMFTIIFLSLVRPLRYFLAILPFGWSILLSHRVMMPYLPLALSLLAGIATVEYLYPLSKSFIEALNLRNTSQFPKAEFTVICLVILISVPLAQNSIGYAKYFEGFTLWAMRYKDVLEWIKYNTNPEGVILVNDKDLGEVIRTLTGRPVVFTISYQDLASSDLEKRMLLMSSLFIRGYDDRVAQRLLYEYNVSYVVVVKRFFITFSMIDVVAKIYVYPPYEEYFPLFVRWMDEKPYLTKIYEDPKQGSYVYQVDQTQLFKGEITLPEVKP